MWIQSMHQLERKENPEMYLRTLLKEAFENEGCHQTVALKGTVARVSRVGES